MLATGFASVAILGAYLFSNSKDIDTIRQSSKDVPLNGDLDSLLARYNDNLKTLPIDVSLYSTQGLLGENQWDVIRANRPQEEITKEWIGGIQEASIINNFNQNSLAFTKDPTKKRLLLPTWTVKPVFVNLRTPKQDPQLAQNYPFTHTFASTPYIPVQDTDEYYYNKGTDILSNGSLDTLNMHLPFNRNTPYSKVNIYRGVENRGDQYASDFLVSENNLSHKRKKIRFA